MKSPYEIKSKKYATYWSMLEEDKNLPKELRSLLSRKVDKSGTFKKVYFETNNKVQWLEIGSKYFFEARQALLQKLSVFAMNPRVLVPEQTIVHEIPVEDDYVVYCVVSQTVRCANNLMEMVQGGKVDNVHFFLMEFVELMDVVFEFIAKDLFFTDLKLENIVFCKDRLALVDVDSVLSLDEAKKGVRGTRSQPAANAMPKLYSMIVGSVGSVRSMGSVEKEKQLRLFYSFYTIFCASVTVLDFYFFLLKKVDLFESVELLLPSLRDWQNELNYQFPDDMEHHGSIKRLLQLSHRTIRFVYLSRRKDYETVLSEWQGSFDKAMELRKRKDNIARKRRKKLLPARAALLF